uniref:cellulase n=1 Tax=Diabrotica virgifera virgifera TaxID=50390 RepID=A0A6P7HAT3_DIAVI
TFYNDFLLKLLTISVTAKFKIFVVNNILYQRCHLDLKIFLFCKIGTDLASNHFDLQIPGGGVGIWNHGCDAQWGAGENGWGRRYDGVSSLEECCLLPEVLQPGCRFRFQFMEGVYRPNVTFQEVQCPAELIAVTACGNLNY